MAWWCFLMAFSTVPQSDEGVSNCAVSVAYAAVRYTGGTASYEDVRASFPTAYRQLESSVPMSVLSAALADHGLEMMAVKLSDPGTAIAPCILLTYPGGVGNGVGHYVFLAGVAADGYHVIDPMHLDAVRIISPSEIGRVFDGHAIVFKEPHARATVSYWYWCALVLYAVAFYQLIGAVGAARSIILRGRRRVEVT